MNERTWFVTRLLWIKAFFFVAISGRQENPVGDTPPLAPKESSRERRSAAELLDHYQEAA